MYYQVIYKANNKTYYTDVEARHYNDVLNFFEKVIEANVIEIREYTYEDNTKKRFDNFDNKKVVLKMLNDKNQLQEIKIPLLKNTVSENDIISNLNGFKIDELPIKKLSFKHL